MERLRSRKAEVARADRRSAARRPASSRRPEAPAGRARRWTTSRDAAGAARRQPRAADRCARTAEEESYTERLLKAKKKVWEERRQDQLRCS